MRFKDRKDAGHLLAEQLAEYKANKQGIVLGLARGGVVVAAEVARALQLPLNVVVPRKISAPHNPEFAIGAIMENGEGVFDERILHLLNVPESHIDAEIEKEKARAKQRIALFRKSAPLPSLKEKIVILVDDGIATGATMLAAIQSVKSSDAKTVVVAVPVAAAESLLKIADAVDQVVCLYTPDDLEAIGYYYENFDQTPDSEVVRIMEEIQSL